MFRTACTTARAFTRPVILCRQTVSGACSSSIGSFIVINDDGWIVTAGHMVDQIKALLDEEATTKNHPAALAAIQANTSLSGKQKYDQIKALGKVGPDSTNRAGVKWGGTDANLIDVKRHPDIDIAVGRLDTFDPASITSYPVFKDPSKDCDPGASLCKYGYPFHSVTPTWDDTAGKFDVGANPIPMFPIEGIFTRLVNIIPSSGTSPYPLQYVETSSPGLRGQSGGPTFDVHGAVWGIQSQTHHFPLGFNPPVPGAKNGETEHQFLNVGWGVHSATVIGVLQELGVNHAVSAF